MINNNGLAFRFSSRNFLHLFNTSSKFTFSVEFNLIILKNGEVTDVLALNYHLTIFA